MWVLDKRETKEVECIKKTISIAIYGLIDIMHGTQQMHEKKMGRVDQIGTILLGEKKKKHIWKKTILHTTHNIPSEHLNVGQ